MHRINTTLKLRPATGHGQTPAAWFLPWRNQREGSLSDFVLTQVSEWKTATSKLRFRIIGQRHDRCAIHGVLVSGTTDVRQGIAQPWIQQANLYLPANSQIFPQVSDLELKSLLDTPSIVDYAWHPTAGLIGFASDDLLTAADFLCCETETRSDWSLAQPGIRLNDRIQSIEAVVQISLDQILQQAQDDIGSDHDLRNAPKAPDENPLAGVSDAINSLAKGFGKLFGSRPGRMATGDMSARQENELKRLMNLLSTDPDKGLKFALPFGGNGFRGLNHSGGGERLTAHHTDFSLTNNRSGPAVVWDIPWEYRQRLLQKYADLATREIQLGRYRRAAYIYSSLLNDDAAAAKTLQQGGFFREAAVIFKDRLKQRQQAAECLRDGGLWQEAIDQFVELNRWDQVAEIHERLEQAEEARYAWKREAAQCSDNGRHRQAALIYEQRLEQPAEAIKVLKTGWVQQGDRKSCLRELIELRIRQGQHESTEADLAWLENTTSGDADQAAMAAEVVAPYHQTHPDEVARQRFGFFVQKLSSRFLGKLTTGSSEQFLKALRILHPADRLLTRDCNRFSRSDRAIRPRVPAGNRGKEMWSIENQHAVSESVHWKAATRIREEVVLAGYRDNKLVLVRCQPSKAESQPNQFEWNLKSLARTPLLLVGQSELRQVMVHQVSSPETLQLEKQWGEPPIRICTAPIPTTSTCALHGSINGNVLQLDVNHTSTWLRFFNLRGSLLTSQVLPSEIAAALEMAVSQTARPPQIATSNQNLFIAAERLLIKADLSKLNDDGAFEREELPTAIVHLGTLPTGPNPSVIACLEEGSLLITKYDNHNIGFGLVRPISCWLSPTSFVLLDRNGVLESYEMKNKMPHLVSTQTIDAQKPLAIFSQGRNSMLVGASDGRIMTFGR